MENCPITFDAPPDESLRQLLKDAKTIAVVGLSPKEDRDSNRVARYLGEHGYKVVPVNPRFDEILGERCYPDLAAVPEHVDIVDIFRGVDAIAGIVDEAIAVGAGTVWMQLGLVQEQAAEKARSAGLCVVMNKCIKIEHSRLM